MGSLLTGRGRRRQRLAALLLSCWVGAAVPVAARCFISGQPASKQEKQEPAQEEEPPKPPAPRTTEARVVDVVPQTEVAPPAGEFFLEWKYALNDTDLQGNRDRSFLHEGLNHILDFSYHAKRPVLGGRTFETLALYRYTDDPRVDPERNSLQRFFTRLTGSSFELTAGDHLVNYSRFSFNQNVKGATLRKDVAALGGVQVTGTAGVFTDRWGALFRGFEKFADPRTPPPDPRFPRKPYTRLVLGLRGQKSLGETNWVAVNYSQGSDIVRTLPAQSQIAPFNNQVLSTDWVLVFTHKLRLAGEVAFSTTQFDSRFQDNKKEDYAVRVELSQQWRRYRWRAEYLRFAPNFFSVNARQVQDLQDVSLRGTVDFTPQLSLTAAFRRTNDNLPGDPVVELIPRRVCNDTEETFRLQPLTNASRTLTVCDPVTGDLVDLRAFDHIVDSEGNRMTTVLRAPEVNLVLRSLPFWKRLVLEFGYRERVVETNNKESFRITTETSPVTPDSVTLLTPLFRERTTQMPYFRSTVPLGMHTLEFAYEYRHNRDRPRPAESTFTHRVEARYRLPPLFLGNWTLSGNFRFETERESKLLERQALIDPVTMLPLVDPIFLRPLFLRTSDGDQTRSLQGSFTVQFPRFFTLDLLYRELDADLLSSFQVSGQRLFGNGGHRRPRLRTQLEFRPRDDENTLVVLTFERNVNTFRVPDARQADTRSFRETLAQVSFVWRFRR